ncbi:hypothetical protein QTV49_003910 [Vibrio vulnificus]|nr:hypothetical protein [Vibrio vulnificus]
MKKCNRNKDEKLGTFEVSDWCGLFTEKQFIELLELTASHSKSKTTGALYDFFVNGKAAYQVHQEHGLNYSVVNRGIWNIVKRHIDLVEYGGKYADKLPAIKVKGSEHNSKSNELNSVNSQDQDNGELHDAEGIAEPQE